MDWVQNSLPGLYSNALKAAGVAPVEAEAPKVEEAQDNLVKREAPEKVSGSILDRIHPRSGKVEPLTSAPDEEPKEKPKREPGKTRCSFWPTCKNAECPFVHPKENVFLSVSEVSKVPLRK